MVIATLTACTKPDMATYYQDADGDGFGDREIVTAPLRECESDEVLIPEKHTKGEKPRDVICIQKNKVKDALNMRLVIKPGDCEDLNPNINPGTADLLVNHLDDDCSGEVDFSTPPEGAPSFYSVYDLEGSRVKRNANPKGWGEVFRAFQLDPFGASIRLSPKERAILDDRKAQERLWQWAKPHLVERIKDYSSAQKDERLAQLKVAKSYAEGCLVVPDCKEKEDAYLATLQSMDCTGLFDAPDAQGYLSYSNPSDCSRFFNHYPPESNWAEALAEAKAKAPHLSEKQKAQGFVFTNLGDEAKRRRQEQTWLYRRAMEMKPENVVHWVNVLDNDLRGSLEE